MEELFQSARYEIIGKIADGGMGAVYLALQHGVEGFSKTVAIKRLLPKFADSEQLRRMFIAEAKIVSDLVHENIVQIYQLARDTQGYFIIMEYVRGLSLHAFINGHRENEQPIPTELAVFIASRIARGLAYAHTRTSTNGESLGIVHRDVSPKNILITTEGLPKLADFGLAIISSEEKDTAKRSLVGKLPYMPPEQANREIVNHQSDQYSLAAVLFEMLTLRQMRLAENREEYLKLASAGSVNWDLLPTDLSPELLTILKTCLMHYATGRYASTEQLAWELEYFIYRDGYGPTIRTLEEYMKKNFSKLYSSPNA